jgi:hypothetical protein
MKLIVVATTLVFASMSSAMPQGGGGGKGYRGHAAAPKYNEERPAKYQFGYAVNDDYSGNNYGHSESRDGPVTKGSYYVALPDGRLQKVTYTVNGNDGYVATVSYEGEAKYGKAEPKRKGYSAN